LERASVFIADRGARQQACELLQAAGFATLCFDGLTPLVRSLQREAGASLVVVDVDGRDEDWRSVIALLREEAGTECAIVGAGARVESASVALDAGADEFVSLPWRMGELVARMQAALRRVRPAGATGPLACGPCTLDVRLRRLVSEQAHVALTSREAALARHLFQAPGTLVSRRALARAWALEEDLVGRSIEQHIYQLRRKLKLCVGQAVSLRSVYGRGYRLVCA
jgi:DNA-binding response OmpR family regulator